MSSVGAISGATDGLQSSNPNRIQGSLLASVTRTPITAAIGSLSDLPLLQAVRINIGSFLPPQDRNGNPIDWDYVIEPENGGQTVVITAQSKETLPDGSPRYTYTISLEGDAQRQSILIRDIGARDNLAETGFGVLQYGMPSMLKLFFAAGYQEVRGEVANPSLQDPQSSNYLEQWGFTIEYQFGQLPQAVITLGSYQAQAAFDILPAETSPAAVPQSAPEQANPTVPIIAPPIAPTVTQVNPTAVQLEADLLTTGPNGQPWFMNLLPESIRAEVASQQVTVHRAGDFVVISPSQGGRYRFQIVLSVIDTPQGSGIRIEQIEFMDTQATFAPGQTPAPGQLYPGFGGTQALMEGLRQFALATGSRYQFLYLDDPSHYHNFYDYTALGFSITTVEQWNAIASIEQQVMLAVADGNLRLTGDRAQDLALISQFIDANNLWPASLQMYLPISENPVVRWQGAESPAAWLPLVAGAMPASQQVTILPGQRIPLYFGPQAAFSLVATQDGASVVYHLQSGWNYTAIIDGVPQISGGFFIYRQGDVINVTPLYSLPQPQATSNGQPLMPGAMVALSAPTGSMANVNENLRQAALQPIVYEVVYQGYLYNFVSAAAGFQVTRQSPDGEIVDLGFMSDRLGPFILSPEGVYFFPYEMTAQGVQLVPPEQQTSAPQAVTASLPASIPNGQYWGGAATPLTFVGMSSYYLDGGFAPTWITINFDMSELGVGNSETAQQYALAYMYNNIRDICRAHGISIPVIALVGGKFAIFMPIDLPAAAVEEIRAALSASEVFQGLQIPISATLGGGQVIVQGQVASLVLQPGEIISGQDILAAIGAEPAALELPLIDNPGNEEIPGPVLQNIVFAWERADELGLHPASILYEHGHFAVQLENGNLVDLHLLEVIGHSLELAKNFGVRPIGVDFRGSGLEAVVVIIDADGGEFIIGNIESLTAQNGGLTPEQMAGQSPEAVQAAAEADLRALHPDLYQAGFWQAPVASYSLAEGASQSFSLDGGISIDILRFGDAYLVSKTLPGGFRLTFNIAFGQTVDIAGTIVEVTSEGRLIVREEAASSAASAATPAPAETSVPQPPTPAAVDNRGVDSSTYSVLPSETVLRNGDIIPGSYFDINDPSTWERELLTVNTNPDSPIYPILQEAKRIGDEMRAQGRSELEIAQAVASYVESNFAAGQGSEVYQAGATQTVGVFMENGGCCRHRAALLQLALQEAGVHSRMVRGTLAMGGTHAWVEVDIAGDGTYSYAIDPNMHVQGNIVPMLENGGNIGFTIEGSNYLYFKNPNELNVIWRPAVANYAGVPMAADPLVVGIPAETTAPGTLPAGFEAQLNLIRQIDPQLADLLEAHLRSMTPEEIAQLGVDITDLRELKEFLSEVQSGQRAIENGADYAEMVSLFNDLGLNPEMEAFSQVAGRAFELRLRARYGHEVADLIMSQVDFSDFSRSQFRTMMRAINKAYLGNNAAIEYLSAIYSPEQVMAIRVAVASDELAPIREALASGQPISESQYQDYQATLTQLQKPVNQELLTALIGPDYATSVETIQGMEARLESVYQESVAAAAQPGSSATSADGQIVNIPIILTQEFGLTQPQADRVMAILNSQNANQAEVIAQLTAELTALGVDINAFKARIQQVLAGTLLTAADINVNIMTRLRSVISTGRGFSREVMQEMWQEVQGTSIANATGFTGPVTAILIEFAVEPEIMEMLLTGQFGEGMSMLRLSTVSMGAGIAGGFATGWLAQRAGLSADSPMMLPLQIAGGVGMQMAYMPILRLSAGRFLPIPNLGNAAVRRLVSRLGTRLGSQALARGGLTALCIVGNLINLAGWALMALNMKSMAQDLALFFAVNDPNFQENMRYGWAIRLYRHRNDDNASDYWAMPDISQSSIAAELAEINAGASEEERIAAMLYVDQQIEALAQGSRDQLMAVLQLKLMQIYAEVWQVYSQDPNFTYEQFNAMVMARMAEFMGRLDQPVTFSDQERLYAERIEAELAAGHSTDEVIANVLSWQNSETSDWQYAGYAAIGIAPALDLDAQGVQAILEKLLIQRIQGLWEQVQVLHPMFSLNASHPNSDLEGSNFTPLLGGMPGFGSAPMVGGGDLFSVFMTEVGMETAQQLGTNILGARMQILLGSVGIFAGSDLLIRQSALAESVVLPIDLESGLVEIVESDDPLVVTYRINVDHPAFAQMAAQLKDAPEMFIPMILRLYILVSQAQEGRAEGFNALDVALGLVDEQGNIITDSETYRWLQILSTGVLTSTQANQLPEGVDVDLAYQVASQVFGSVPQESI